MNPNHPTNQEIAEVLERVAALLEAQDANPFRVNAYRKAARLVERSDRFSLRLRFPVRERNSKTCRTSEKALEGLFGSLCTQVASLFSKGWKDKSLRKICS